MCEVCRDNFNDFGGDIGIFNFKFQLFWKGLMLSHEIKVIQEHLTPCLFLRSSSAIVIQVRLPLR